MRLKSFEYPFSAQASGRRSLYRRAMPFESG
jgi:hypothetical protein